MNRWTILAVLFVARASLGVGFQAVGSVADQLAAAFAIAYTEVGTLIGLFMVPGLLLSLPAGFAGRYLSDRGLTASGLAAMALGGTLLAFGDGFAWAALGRLLCGAGFVFATIYFTKMVTDWFAGREIATAMAVLVMSWPFGIALGQAGNGWLVQAFGWRSVFHAASLSSLLGLLLVLLLYRAPAESSVRAPQAGNSRPSRHELRLVSLAAMVWALFNAAYIVYLSFAPLLLGQAGYAALNAAAIASLASWVMIASGPICGLIADRSGRSDLVLYTCLIAGAATLLLLPQAAFAVPLCLAFGLIGMSPAGVIMALPGEVLRPENRAFGMGIFFSFYFVITAPAPVVAGWLYDRTHDAFWPIAFASLLLLATAAFNLAFRSAQHRGRAKAALEPA